MKKCEVSLFDFALFSFFAKNSVITQKIGFIKKTQKSNPILAKDKNREVKKTKP